MALAARPAASATGARSAARGNDDGGPAERGDARDDDGCPAERGDARDDDGRMGEHEDPGAEQDEDGGSSAGNSGRGGEPATAAVAAS